MVLMYNHTCWQNMYTGRHAIPAKMAVYEPHSEALLLFLSYRFYNTRLTWLNCANGCPVPWEDVGRADDRDSSLASPSSV